MVDDAPPRAVITGLELLEIAPAEHALGADVAARLSHMLSLPCRVGTAPLALEVPVLPMRAQADADRLLAAVEALGTHAGHVLVALTGHDIGHPIFTHFFGRARRGGTAVLVSTVRLDPLFYGLPANRGLTVRRTVLEILHELGHAGGLGHCDMWDCVMHFAATVDALDNRGAGFCSRCAAELPPSLRCARPTD